MCEYLLCSVLFFSQPLQYHTHNMARITPKNSSLMYFLSFRNSLDRVFNTIRSYYWIACLSMFLFFFHSVSRSLHHIQITWTPFQYATMKIKTCTLTLRLLNINSGIVESEMIEAKNWQIDFRVKVALSRNKNRQHFIACVYSCRLCLHVLEKLF